MAQVRATRAYIAGFGTAGSLLAGAAIVFFFASAVVSFRGWPQVGTQATPAAVIAGPARPTSSHALVRQFLALASARTPSAAGAGAGSGAGTGPAAHRLASAQPGAAILAATPLGSQPAHPASFNSTTPTGSGASPPPTTPPCSSCGRPTLGATLGAVTQAATTTLGSTVASTGSQLGSVVTGLTGGVANKLGAVSPGLGQIVDRTGQAVGGTVGSTTGALGGTISGVGKGLSGILTRH